MTERLYLVDATIQDFDAVVVAVDQDRIELDRTAFTQREAANLTIRAS